MAERVAVIGAGQMGNGIAHVFAQSGFPVTMIDVSDDALERGRDTIASNLDRQIKKGTLAAARQGRDPRPHRDRRAGSPRSPARGSSIEAATENRDLKFRHLLRARDAGRHGRRSSPRTRARSRSPRSPARTKRPELVIGMHFMNPVPVMQLVEVIRGLATSDDDDAARARDCARRLGKTPVEVQDYPGLRREPHPDADDQRGGLLPHGRRRHAPSRSTR